MVARVQFAKRASAGPDTGNLLTLAGQFCREATSIAEFKFGWR